MNTNELLLYLHNVRDLEQICYTCDKSINSLQYRANKLGICKKIKLPEKEDGFFHGPDFELEIVYGISFLIGIIIPIIYCMTERKHWQGSILGSIAAFFLVLIGGAVIAVLIMVLVYIIGYIYSIIQYFKEKKRCSQKYVEDYKQYCIKIDLDKERVRNELHVKSNIMLQCNTLKSSRSNTQELLNNLYSYNIIYPKYRNMVAVTMFCEYLESGRCMQLQGYDGAYNLFEKELRDGIIIAELKTISNQLESIRQTQYMLYEEMKRGNDIANKISKSAEQMESNSEIEKYNAEVIAQNSAIIAQEAKMQGIWRDFGNM